MPNPTAGFFGKLPCAGDFVQRRLSAGFVDVWDQHFEGAVAASRVELGADWHDAYLDSPVWRFVLAPGVCGDSAWLGIMGPGVDRVGRCFPMVIAAPLASHGALAAQTLTQAIRWFDAAEQAHAMAQADARVSVEAFDEQVAALADPLASPPAPPPALLHDIDWGGATHWQLSLPGAPSSETFVGELLERLSATSGRWCVWWTAGSERVPACALATNGLPAAAAYAAFLDARYGASSWSSPAAFRPLQSRQPATPVAASDVLDDLMAAAPAISASTPGLAPTWLPDDLDLLADLVPAPEPAPAPPSTLPADPVAIEAEAKLVAHAAVTSRVDCALTVVSAEVGVANPRQRAVDEVSELVRTMACDDLTGNMQALRTQLLMLNPPLRQAGEDLIDPVLEDCAVIAAHVAGGQASLLRIGSAGAWHYRKGRVQPLFAQNDEPLPGGDGGDGFDDLLFSSAAPAVPGLGAADRPVCGEVRCEAMAGDRLLLLASQPLLQLSADVLASNLALPSVEEARLRLAGAAGLGTDAARWPLTIIEVGA